MQDFHVEERSYVRENKSLNSSRRSMVMQERIFFRNIPLSNWIEHELVVEEGRDLDQLPKPSVFSSPNLPAGEPRPPISKILSEKNVRSKTLSEVTLDEATFNQVAFNELPFNDRALREVTSARKAPESQSLVPAHAAAFGAQ
jgi:hypothetical protein